MAHTILVVGDAGAGSRARARCFREAGFEVLEAAAGTDALELASAARPAVVVLPLELPGAGGFRLCRQLKADPRTASIPVLHISGRGGSAGYPESLRSGAEACLQEPVDPPVLLEVVQALLETRPGPDAPGKAESDAAANQRLAALIDSIPDEVWFADNQGRFTLANPSALREFRIDAPGLTTVEDLARSLEVLRPDGAPRPLEEAPPLRALRGETVRAQEEIIRTPASGDLRYREVSASPVRDAAGMIVGSVSVVRDITERKKAEQALRAGEERHRTLFERMTEAFALGEVICGEDGAPCDLRCLTLNPAFERQTGIKGERVSGRTLREVFPAAEAVWVERLGAVALTGGPARFEAWFGPLKRWFEVSAFRAGPGRFGVLFTDVTARRSIEEERQYLAAELANRVGELQAILDAAPVPIWIAHDPQCRRITGNAYADQVVMHARPGGNISLSAPPDSGAPAYRVFREGVELRPEELPAQVAAATGRPTRQEELELVFPDGRAVTLLMAAVPLFDALGNVRGAVAAGADVTRIKKAEEVLKESETVLRSFFDSPGVIRGIVELAEGRIIHVSCNIPAAAALGVDRDAIAGKSLTEAGAPPEIERMWLALSDEIRSTGQPVSREYLRRAAGGQERWLHVTACYVGLGRNGNPRFAYTGFDVTERKRTEEALRNSERIYRAIGESIDYGVWVCDPDGRNTYASESFLNLVGLTQEQCSSFGWGDVLHPEDSQRTIAAWKECVRTEGVWDIEHRFRGVDGEWHPILARGVPVRDEQGRITRWAGINLDIGRLKRAEQSLRESERRERARAAELEAVMNAAPGMILIARDDQCRYLAGNSMAYDLLRRPPGSNLSKSAPEDERPANFRVMKGGVEMPLQELPPQKAALTGQPVRDCEIDLAFDDGSSVSLLGNAVPMLDENGRPRGAVGVFIDITERKRAEDRLREAQKLESLGLLAGGVAHDFNNLLVGVVGNASLAKEILPPGDPAVELLDGVIKTGEQAAHLTRQMLAYAGRGKFLLEPLDLSALIPEMSALLRTSISKKIALHFNLEKDLPAIEADRGQVQQVFMNLALNAAEAIGSGDGLISIRTGVQDVDGRFLRLHPQAASLPPGRYVCLEVTDTGCGMDEATRARIFDPFFSTKFTGRGLGLAAVAGIVRGHGGAITVSSMPGQGSCFTVLLPQAARGVDQRPAVAGADALHGAGTVLVVDDEQIVREMARKALQRHGYTVLQADGGPAAIDIFRRYPGEIALVLLDLSMPGMSGEETLRGLRKIRPDVKVVLSSGYSEAETMEAFQGQPVSGFIQKPYTARGLAEKVKAWVS
ncbi:MAG: PAS domain S-box protein [Bryobacterales bacterium]|nr:PAS domain S-box protein [Bryobacterales bacterium]